MDRFSNRFSTALLVLFAGVSVASAEAPLSPAAAPKATPQLLRELALGADEVRVIVGVADGTPSARSLLLRPDPEGEPQRQARRRSAQERLASELAQARFAPRHFYQSFSMMAGSATREGIIELANRPDVSWVTIDGTKRLLQATPQNAQLLINSNQANGLGFTGAGQTIALLDTGVDYTISTMGGGGFPNAKVIGGADVADKDGDPMDCGGHGTEVAGVIAGPNGVAPDAKIVAIKVFSSQSPDNSSCKIDGFDSDIIAGVDYAVANNAAYGITAINLSLGGAFGDAADHGYCDAQEIAYASAFDSATAAGLVVVAAAGNDSTIHALAIPACLSSAVSVGAVYPDTHARISWPDGNNGIQCTDQPVVPDQIVCFSDSNSNLSLLAPGAFWQVASKGGVATVFHGTSASTPSVAGAIALLKQARPDLTPAGLIGVLRSTGKPLTDPRNNITTPRVDTLAAVKMVSSNFASVSAVPVPIPDGTGSAIASATISNFTKTIASVQAWVEIDHPDPSQLTLTLTGPDGTSAILQDQTGQLEHPINAIYGRTDSTAQSLEVFRGHRANGVWTVKVEDKVTGVSGRIVDFAITLVPEEPAAPIIRGAPRAQPGVVPFRR